MQMACLFILLGNFLLAIGFTLVAFFLLLSGMYLVIVKTKKSSSEEKVSINNLQPSVLKSTSFSAFLNISKKNSCEFIILCTLLSFILYYL